MWLLVPVFRAHTVCTAQGLWEEGKVGSDAPAHSASGGVNLRSVLGATTPSRREQARITKLTLAEMASAGAMGPGSGRRDGEMVRW